MGVSAVQGLRLGDSAGGGQSGIQRPPRVLGHEVCRLHTEGETAVGGTVSCNIAISPGCLQQAWCIVPLSVCRESTAAQQYRGITEVSYICESRHAEIHQVVCLVPHENEGKVHVQVYATSMAMLVTTVVSVLFFGLQPSLQLLLGIVTASISLALYYVSPNLLLETGKVQKLPR
jgi:hypothetical protein